LPKILLIFSKKPLFSENYYENKKIIPWAQISKLHSCSKNILPVFPTVDGRGWGGDSVSAGALPRELRLRQQ
jgi:hypothetical protein